MTERSNCERKCDWDKIDSAWIQYINYSEIFKH